MHMQFYLAFASSLSRTRTTRKRTVNICVICNTNRYQHVVNTSFDTPIHHHYRHHLQQDHQASFAKSSCLSLSSSSSLASSSSWSSSSASTFSSSSSPSSQAPPSLSLFKPPYRSYRSLLILLGDLRILQWGGVAVREKGEFFRPHKSWGSWTAGSVSDVVLMFMLYFLNRLYVLHGKLLVLESRSVLWLALPCKEI